MASEVDRRDSIVLWFAPGSLPPQIGRVDRVRLTQERLRGRFTFGPRDPVVHGMGELSGCEKPLLVPPKAANLPTRSFPKLPLLVASLPTQILVVLLSYTEEPLHGPAMSDCLRHFTADGVVRARGVQTLGRQNDGSPMECMGNSKTAPWSGKTHAIQSSWAAPGASEIWMCTDLITLRLGRRLGVCPDLVTFLGQ